MENQENNTQNAIHRATNSSNIENDDNGEQQILNAETSSDLRNGENISEEASGEVLDPMEPKFATTDRANDLLASPTSSVLLGYGKRVRKYGFRFKKSDIGNILTIHHTLEQGAHLIRIRIAACCFNEHSNIFVAIDCRGNIFVFDMENKRHWQLIEVILKASVIMPWIKRPNQFLVGTKRGQLLLLDLEKSAVTKALAVSSDAIRAISFPGQPLHPKHLVLVQTGYDAILINLENFAATHRLSFDELNISLKFACFLPHSDQIFTCFTNDAVYIWSSVTLNTLRVIHPIKARDRKLRMQGEAAITAEFTICQDYENAGGGEYFVKCQDADYANGLIISYCCHPDNGLLCLSTLDKYLLLLNTYTFELQYICRLVDIIIRECVFLPHSKEILICGLTSDAKSMVVLNCLQKDSKFRINATKPKSLTISYDYKLLAVVNNCGEINMWSVCKLYNALKRQEECLQLVKAAFKQSKPVGICVKQKPADTEQEDHVNNLIKGLLNRDSLLAVLCEYRWFPCKYRTLIWCALLELPYNRREFQQLLKLGIPHIVKQPAKNIQMHNETLKRALVRVWSCLAHWCPVFAHSKFIPQLIFPFVKLFPRNALVSFEICATLLVNQYQLCFELHPLEPSNYLGLCENILQLYAPELCKFYASMHVGPEHYVWPMISSAFSEVFIEDHWLCVWDNIVARPAYLPIFIAVAYNILQREIIVRLPDKPTILTFFHEPSPTDIRTLINKAYDLLLKCPETLHPKRYMKEFQPIPKHVYPKFLNYPREWLEKHEQDVEKVQREQRCIDARIRQLEMEEMKLLERLENGLRNEEHVKQVKKMEKLYHDSLKREEERLACQRKMLMLYQKEIRSRKVEVAAQVQESEQRKRALQMEKDLELLMQSIECEVCADTQRC
ncbi:TBC1 domain family member 31 isoform X2 [Eurosta solidaginis]|uniref:TBC1 domain family member 31 isoform X2 n=1 Tax=Eurosta solidaginis TaxID=178769 RepID=UPI003530C67D